MMRMLSVLLLTACATDPAPAPDGPGPMRPLGPDRELDAAAPIDIRAEATMRPWVDARVAAANAHQRERVRLPVVRRTDALDCDCPAFAIAPDPDHGPIYWLALEDRTSAGIPEGDWTGWVDGHFTGAMRSYYVAELGEGTVEAPVFTVYRQSRRDPVAAPEARVVREK